MTFANSLHPDSSRPGGHDVVGKPRQIVAILFGGGGASDRDALVRFGNGLGVAAGSGASPAELTWSSSRLR
jgi:hypothetical protein